MQARTFNRGAQEGNFKAGNDSILRHSSLTTSTPCFSRHVSPACSPMYCVSKKSFPSFMAMSLRNGELGQFADPSVRVSCLFFTFLPGSVSFPSSACSQSLTFSNSPRKCVKMQMSESHHLSFWFSRSEEESRNLHLQQSLGVAHFENHCSRLNRPAPQTLIRNCWPYCECKWHLYFSDLFMVNSWQGHKSLHVILGKKEMKRSDVEINPGLTQKDRTRAWRTNLMQRLTPEI